MRQVPLAGGLIKMGEVPVRVADLADLMLNGEPLTLMLALLFLLLVDLNFDGAVVESPVFHHLHVLQRWVEKGGRGAPVEQGGVAVGCMIG